MTATDIGRQLVELLELDLDRCTNIYGVSDSGSTCTAGRTNSGTAQAGAAGSITLAAGASSVDNTYNNQYARIVGGTGAFQERKITGYIGATRVATVTPNWTTVPDATSAYNTIDRPNACYNTFRTCQDTANYVKGTHTYRFCGRGTPSPVGVIVRPYLTRLELAPTEADPEKGLGVRTSIRAALTDAPDLDTEQDPYVADRAVAAGSTFWRREVARTLAYAGRAARVKRLYIAPGAAYTLGDAGWVTEQFIADAINGPNRAGDVQITLKDPLKLADRSKLPVATDGELLSAMTAASLSLTLKTGKGAQYGASGYVAVSGKEAIQFTARAGDVLSWPDTTYRGRFGTAAQTHNVNARVQLCKVWSAATIGTVLEELLNAAGIVDANIDLAGIAAEQATWFPSYSITVCLAEPETIGELLKEFLVALQAVIWWSGTEQKVKFLALRPLSLLAAAPPVITDSAHLIDGSVEVTRQEANRVTAVAVWYAPLNATEKRDEKSNYQRVYLVVDTDAQGANEYNEPRTKTVFARFLDITSDQAAAELAVRMLNFRRDAPIEIRAKIDPKDGANVDLGKQLDLETYGIVDFDGDVARQRVLVTRKQDNGEDIDVSLLVTFLNRRYFWIAPDAHPDYGVATTEERRYGYISDAAGKLSDGSDGHVIV